MIIQKHDRQIVLFFDKKISTLPESNTSWEELRNEYFDTKYSFLISPGRIYKTRVKIFS